MAEESTDTPSGAFNTGGLVCRAVSASAGKTWASQRSATRALTPSLLLAYGRGCPPRRAGRCEHRYSASKGANPSAARGHGLAASQADANQRRKSSQWRGAVAWRPNGTPFG